jgi:hypothetical protein
MAEYSIHPVAPITEFERITLGVEGLAFERIDRRTVVVRGEDGLTLEVFDVRDFAYSARPGTEDFMTAVAGFRRLNPHVVGR